MLLLAEGAAAVSAVGEAVGVPTAGGFGVTVFAGAFVFFIVGVASNRLPDFPEEPNGEDELFEVLDFDEDPTDPALLAAQPASSLERGTKNMEAMTSAMNILFISFSI